MNRRRALTTLAVGLLVGLVAAGHLQLLPRLELSLPSLTETFLAPLFAFGMLAALFAFPRLAHERVLTIGVNVLTVICLVALAPALLGANAGSTDAQAGLFEGLVSLAVVPCALFIATTAALAGRISRGKDRGPF